MTVGDRIRIARERSSLSQEALAKKMGLKDRSSISKIEKSGNNVTLYQIEKICEALGCSIEYIMGFNDNDSCIDQIVRIPILGRVAAGKPILATEYIEGYEEIPKKMASTGEYFALRIRGDSMSPKIEDGDIVIVRQADSADDGKIVIALVESNESAVCKRLKVYQDSLVLWSINPEYAPISGTSKNQIKIIGEVVQIRRTL